MYISAWLFLSRGTCVHAHVYIRTVSCYPRSSFNEFLFRLKSSAEQKNRRGVEKSIDSFVNGTEERQRERERERECVCVCVCERERERETLIWEVFLRVRWSKVSGEISERSPKGYDLGNSVIKVTKTAQTSLHFPPDLSLGARPRLLQIRCFVNAGEDNESSEFGKCAYTRTYVRVLKYNRWVNV